MRVEITVTDSEAIMSTPMGGNVYSNHLIITKEAFIECYEKWVKPIKHGRWIPSKDGHGCECSECGTAYRWSEADTMRYCKICGAKMDKVTEW